MRINSDKESPEKTFLFLKEGKLQERKGLLRNVLTCFIKEVVVIKFTWNS